MKKIIENFKANLIANICILAIGFSLGVTFFFLYIFVFYTPIFLAMVDACFFTAALYLGIALLMLVARWGFFDPLAYGFSYLGNMIFHPRKIEKKYDDLVDYRDQKMAKRKEGGYFYISFLILGILFLVATLVFYFLYLNAVN